MATLRLERQTAEVDFELSAELRYRGQKHSLRVDMSAPSMAAEIAGKFHGAYALRYGHSDPAASIEFVTLKATAYSRGNAIELASLHRFEAGADPRPAPQHRMVYYPSLKKRVSTPIYARDTLPRGFAAPGPVIIEDYGSTIVVEPRDRFAVGDLGEITIFCD
jgi:N-methylhydantoinase A